MSTLKVDTLQTTGGAGLYPARAWLNYNQVVVGITNSANVSSVTDVATGQYTVSFTNAFSASTYCAGSVGFRRVAESYARYVHCDGDDTQATTSSMMRTSYGGNGKDVESNKISWTL
jgi:hypothetical protein